MRAKGEFVEALPNTNVILAAYTTAQARSQLYVLLELILYFDTDSIMCMMKQRVYHCVLLLGRSQELYLPFRDVRHGSITG